MNGLIMHINVLIQYVLYESSNQSYKMKVHPKENRRLCPMYTNEMHI